MPRPGPRPYECVRRAWHSDRHQPIRGSIIQQIFRVVTEAHSPGTRKNREWQEKLPRVVLKAEEIMYSKANSEAEYMDPETLWSRLNDAVDTIIRRDESTETGQFLQPCIEAALVLGCVPVRASRSQRHINPRGYLSPGFRPPNQAASVPLDRNHPRIPPQVAPYSSYQATATGSTMANQTTSTLFNSQIANTSYIAAHTGPHLQSSIPRPVPSVVIESNTSSNFGSVYPLFHGSNYQNIEFQHVSLSPQNSYPNNVITGTPVGWPAGQTSRFACTRNLLPDENEEITIDKFKRVKEVHTHRYAAEKDCDLSLRLGPSDPCTSGEKGRAHVTEGGSCSYRESIKHSDQHARNHEFCFLPRRNASDPSEPCNNRLETEAEFQVDNASLRKRKAHDPHEQEDGCIKWLTERRPEQCGDQSRWPGTTIR